MSVIRRRRQSTQKTSSWRWYAGQHWYRCRHRWQWH